MDQTYGCISVHASKDLGQDVCIMFAVCERE